MNHWDSSQGRRAPLRVGVLHHVGNRTLTFHGSASTVRQLLLPLFQEWTFATLVLSRQFLEWASHNLLWRPPHLRHLLRYRLPVLAPNHLCAKGHHNGYGLLWPGLLWPIPTLARPTLANSYFGQFYFGQFPLWPVLLWPILLWPVLLWPKSVRFYFGQFYFGQFYFGQRFLSCLFFPVLRLPFFFFFFSSCSSFSFSCLFFSAP